MTAVTKIVAHQHAGSDASLGFVEVGHTRLLWADLKRFRGPEFTLELLGYLLQVALNYLFCSKVVNSNALI